jgi:hypothetical protein
MLVIILRVTQSGRDSLPARGGSVPRQGALIDTQALATRIVARHAVAEYIAWYNGTRLHSTLGRRASGCWVHGWDRKDFFVSHAGADRAWAEWVAGS